MSLAAFSFISFGGARARVTLKPTINNSDLRSGSGASAGFRLENDGDIILPISTGSLDDGDWIVPRSAAGAAYECRATMSSGTAPTGTFGSWLALSLDREWNLLNAGGVSTLTSIFTVEIRLAAGGAVLGSTLVTLIAENI